MLVFSTPPVFCPLQIFSFPFLASPITAACLPFPSLPFPSLLSYYHLHDGQEAGNGGGLNRAGLDRLVRPQLQQVVRGQLLARGGALRCHVVS